VIYLQKIKIKITVDKIDKSVTVKSETFKTKTQLKHLR